MYHIVDPHETNKEDTKVSQLVASFHAQSYYIVLFYSWNQLFSFHIPLPNAQLLYNGFRCLLTFLY